MAGRKTLAMTDRQFAILRLLWEHGPLTVRELIERLAGGEQQAFGTLQARTFGQVGDDGNLRLVIEGEQLDGHRLGREEQHHQEGRGADGEQKSPCGTLRRDHRASYTAIELTEPAFAVV